MKINFKELYLNSPKIFQNILLNIYGYIIWRRRYNKFFYRYLNYYMISDQNKVDLNQLKKFMKSANETNFWKNRFIKYNVNINSFDLIKEIEKLPILTKDEVKENIEAIVNPKYLKKSIKASTSGTSGSGLVFPYTIEMENKQWAIWWRYRTRLDLSINTWMGWFGGRQIINKNSDEIYKTNYFMKQIMFNPFHLNKENIHRYHKIIINKKLSWLHGYPSQISLLSYLILEENLEPLNNVKIITLGAENLLENQRNIIRQAFNCKLFQHYGLAEGVSNISENLENDLIIDQDFAYTEFIKQSNQYKIIGTSYNNLAFPLIRYDTNDLVTLDDQNKILKIEGRNEDYITLPNGTKLGRLDHIFKEFIEVKEAQIYQKDGKNIIIRIVKGALYDNRNIEHKIKIECEKRFGKELNIEFTYLETITKTKNGKLKFVISEL